MKFKTFIAHNFNHGDYDCIVADLENQIQNYLNSHPGAIEVHRSTPSVTASPHGEYNSETYVFIAVTCEFNN